MSCWALVPLKELSACKSRLAPYLPPSTRIQLVNMLLDHVIGALRRTPEIDHIVVVSPQRNHIAEDVQLFRRERMGLNEDLAYALNNVARRGATHAIVVPADLPLLGADDVSALLQAVPPAGVAIAPDRHDCGTNALAMELPTRLSLAFGDHSFANHLSQCRDSGCDPAVVRRTGWAFDVDEIEDLRELQRYRGWSQLATLRQAESSGCGLRSRIAG